MAEQTKQSHILENGKYVFEYDGKFLTVYRNGEQWQDYSGSKFMYLLWAEIADLKQQLHAYKEYHDARDAYEKANAVALEFPGDPLFEEINRIRKANAELQTLRNKGN